MKRNRKIIQNMLVRKTFYNKVNLPITQKKKKINKSEAWAGLPACRRCSNLSVHTGAVLAHRTAPAPKLRHPDTSV